jgi:glutathione peroxidase-family protein
LTEESQETVYEFSAPLLSGSTVSLADFRGRVLLIVNTASKCGFTPQYAGLEELYRAYKDRGFLVLGFPSNQFGAQEPGSAAEIGAFCEKNYGVSFPIFARIDVNGPPCPPPLSLPQAKQARHLRCLRHAKDQVELYQVPRRPEGQSGGTLRPPHRAKVPCDPH